MSDYKANSSDRLEKLLAEYKKNNSIEKLTELAEELRISNIHMPCRSDGNGRIAAMIIKMKDGKAFIPIYSSKWHLNGKLNPGTKVAVLPYLEANAIAAKEAVRNHLDGIIINPQDSNIILSMNFINHVNVTAIESQRTGKKIPLDFSSPAPGPDNSKIDEIMERFAAEKDIPAKQVILNDLLNALRGSILAVPVGVNDNGKNAPLIMTNNNTGEKYMPVYTSAPFAAKRHEGCKVAMMEFDGANDLTLTMGSEVDGMCIISGKVTVNLKTKLLENVRDTNIKIREQKRAPVLPPEQLKFTMETVPGLMEKRGQAFIDQLLDRKEAYLDELYENAYSNVRKYPYVREEFTVTAINAAPGKVAIEIEYPTKGNCVGSAIRAYIIWDEEEHRGRYFGVCRNADDALMIMEVSEEGQTCHGITAIETNEMSRILDICGL